MLSSILNTVRLREMKHILSKVNQLSDQMSELTDDALKAKTSEFKQRLKANQDTLDTLLPEAYAVMREALKRVNGQYPYDVQVLGAIVMHQGDIAEMKTGEGKTLTATMPLYLNALTGKGVFLVTANEYLADRDCNEMRPVFEWLGLTIASRTPSINQEKISTTEKQRIYASEVVYTTNSVLGFDYLLDNLTSENGLKIQRSLDYVIVDEVDSVLLDGAQTPLVISGVPRLQSNLFEIAQSFIETLEEEHYQIDEEKRQIWLTNAGTRYVCSYFSLDMLEREENFQLLRHLYLALKANHLHEKQKHYLILDDKITLLDEKSGRLLQSTKLQGGIHQAIEAKERVTITKQNRSMASITFENLFSLFPRLAGMSGTSRADEDEFIESYGMRVVQIPTNVPIQRLDLATRFFWGKDAKDKAVIETLLAYHEQGRPILLITDSVRLSEGYSAKLNELGIVHNVLNAHNEAREAQIIKEAGLWKAVTIATAMAGRGTDIRVAPQALEVGGLAVLGTQIMANQRIDWQLRGRAGRQGDPGSSQFFISLDDPLITKYGPRKLRRKLFNLNRFNSRRLQQEIKSRNYTRLVNKVQYSNEAMQEQARKMTFLYNESMSFQRNIIYQLRNNILENQALSTDWIVDFIRDEISQFTQVNDQQSRESISSYILENLSYQFSGLPHNLNVNDPKELEAYLIGIVKDSIEVKRRFLKEEHSLVWFYRTAMLKAIDEAWIEQVDFLQQLRTAVTYRQTAQKNPVFEYTEEALEAFNKMKPVMRQSIVKCILLSSIERSETDEYVIFFG